MVSATAPLFNVQNRGFKYGDGVFETIRMQNGQMPLAPLHFERLFTGVQLLQMHAQFTGEQLLQHISALCQLNACSNLARVRLSVFRAQNNQAHFAIEAHPLHAASVQWEAKGLKLGLFSKAQKSTDLFSNLKSANFLPYVLAAKYADEHALDDCVLLNAAHAICDTTKANLFLVKDRVFVTPALDQGCVAGVMRRYLLGALKQNNWRVYEQAVVENDLLQADEAFVTNAVLGLRQVHCYKNKSYGNAVARQVFSTIIAPLFNADADAAAMQPSKQVGGN